ncbi:hypothetical protein FALBO_11134 [Fusarium albosuccineum]|uniref:Uncharacterized protein n=1 Tax=Fusarium albosuccineum TaxID=1237068 RepID=A0A8H4L6G4_9HYPO|nr:hypothetical protein FALBO_11134 [Fusarium albosuccineum]
MQRLKRLLFRRRPKPPHEPLAPTPAASAGNLSLSKLEQLPFEIRNEILLAVDTTTDLCALVHASPTFHQQYRLDRAFWLWHCLQLEMGHVLIDAYTANLCNMPEFRLKRTRQKVLQIIDDYKLQRSTVTEALSKPAPEEDVICITTFHSHNVRPLLQQYISWARTNLEGLSVPDQLSRTEQRRIIRGLYRFQIFCNLFGGVHGAKHGRRGDVLEAEDRLELFLDEYEPWEVEEILCINAFVDAKYRSVFEEVQWDLHPDNPSFDAERTGPQTPPGAFRLVNDSDDWISETTEPYLQERRREHRYSDRDKAQDSREKMSFNGDKDDSPPLAWVTIWNEAYSNLYSDFIPEPLRRWGYIMWDGGRLADSGAAAIMDREWKTMYGGLDEDGETEDPRDDMLAYN